MTPIIAASPATTADPDAIAALSGQARVPQPATGLDPVGHLTRWGVCPGGGAVRPGGAASEGSATQPMNSGAGGGTAATHAEAPAAAVAPKGGAASEGSETQPMNSGAGGGMAAV